jgi:hypothetical protein
MLRRSHRCHSGLFPGILLLLSFLFVPTGIASTISIISGSATVDGRPLLVKNRDNSSNPYQEFHYNNNGPLAYISVTYAGIEDQAWGGVNEAGFAVVNADAWNFPDTVAGPDDDGIIMDWALRTCYTVADFEAIMDSTDVTGRTWPTMYGVLDASGDGAIFECEPNVHYRFDLDDSSAAPNGYMVRANFAYEGGSYHLGQHRHDRYLALLDSAYAYNLITHRYLTQVIQRDLVNEETDPYPLPFTGREETLPYGLIRTHDAINRDITRSGCVIQGILPGEDPLCSTLWAIVGEPTATPSLPLWVRGASTPPAFDGPVNSPLNLRAQEFCDYLYQRNWSEDAIDTWKLVDDSGEGLLPFLTELEDQAAAAADSALSIWRVQGLPTSAEVADFQNNLAQNALELMEAWGPPQSPEIILTLLTPDEIELNWQPVTRDVFERPITVSAYTVFGSNTPFIDRFHGDSIATVSAPPISITISDSMRFFQVRASP